MNYSLVTFSFVFENSGSIRQCTFPLFKVLMCTSELVNFCYIYFVYIEIKEFYAKNYGSCTNHCAEKDMGFKIYIAIIIFTIMIMIGCYF